MGAWDTTTAKCPYCGEECECDWVDVGVGLAKAGPYYCENCGSSEMYLTDFDRDDVSEEEKDMGWFKGCEKVSKAANTIGGVLVDIKTAEIAYRRGFLDEKEP